MSNLEPGCLAIIIDGVNHPNHKTNIGKIVTVGSYIGFIKGMYGKDYWEVDRIMFTNKGRTIYYNREINMQRIDDHDEKIEDKELLEMEI